MPEKRKIIGVILCTPQDETNADYVEYISTYASSKGFKTLFFGAFSDFALDTTAIEIFGIINYDLLDAIIIVTESIKSQKGIDEICENARKRNIPIVSVMTPANGSHNISFDFTGNFRKIIDHVIEVHNAKRIFYISGTEGNAFAQERLDCFLDAMREHGLEVDMRGIGYGDFWAVPTYALLDRWFLEEKLPKPDAIICANDAMALAACIKLAEYGYKVPGDIIVTGHDGIEIEKHHSPRLTNAVTNIEGAAYRAVDTIIDLLDGKTIEKNIVIDSKLVISESCGCVEIVEHALNKKIAELYDLANSYDSFSVYLNAMATDLANENELESFIRKLHKYMPSSFAGCAWICMPPDSMMPRPLTSDELADESGADPRDVDFFRGDKLMSLINWRAEIEECEEMLTLFDREELVPNLEAVLDERDMIMFTPICYSGKFQGYIAFCFDAHFRPLKFTSTFMNYLAMVFELVKHKFSVAAVLEQLKSMYILDYMTSLYNRRGFYTKIKPRLDDCINKKHDLMIVFTDMDGLKVINDTHGHAEGDNAIKTLATLLTKSAGDDMIVARFGGDEFVVAGVFPDGEATASKFKRTFNKNLAKFNEFSGLPYKISSSFGVTVTKADENTNLDDLIEYADTIAYRQKARRKMLRGTPT